MIHGKPLRASSWATIAGIGDLSSRFWEGGPVLGRFAQHFLESWLHRFGPSAKAVFIGMKAIGHQFFFEGSVVVKKDRSEVEPVDGFAIDVGFDDFVDLFIGLAAEVLGILSTREDGEEIDFFFGDPTNAVFVVLRPESPSGFFASGNGFGGRDVLLVGGTLPRHFFG